MVMMHRTRGNGIVDGTYCRNQFIRQWWVENGYWYRTGRCIQMASMAPDQMLGHQYKNSLLFVLCYLAVVIRVNQVMERHFIQWRWGLFSIGDTPSVITISGSPAMSENSLPGRVQAVSGSVGQNRDISQIPQCIKRISHNAPIFHRNVHICAHCGVLWDLIVTK